ncbi:hypothetical protein [Halobacillus sp. K22]|uniref:hypothetical protein n=1 Tax=Halobacillus sp. K22 TaxID=3457431 RepID=UPI003FCE2EAE
MKLKVTQLQQAENNISCIVTNLSCTELLQRDGRQERDFTLPNGSTVTLQRVNLRVTGTAMVTFEDGTTESAEFSICESYYLCAPQGTAIDCQVIEYSCQICTVTTSEINVVIDVCVEVKSITTVTLSMDAVFCNPRAQQIDNFCPPPVLPPQCPAVFGRGTSESETSYPLLASNPLIGVQLEENLCMRAAKVYDWIQDRIHTTLAIGRPLITGRIFNVDQGTFYDLIDVAFEDANSGDTLLISPGTYPQDTSLLIDKSLTLRGSSAEQTRITFPDTIPDAAALRLRANNITVERLSLSRTTDENAKEEETLLEIPQRAPGEYYKGIAIRDSILEGGKRTARVKAENLTFEGNTIIHTGDEESIAVKGALGETTIKDNAFRGGALSQGTVSFARAREEDRFEGTLRLERNRVERHTQLALFDTRKYEDVSILVRENEMDHQDRGGNSIVFLPFEFPGVDSILIEDNDITNPHPGWLAVYVDYNSGGETSPEPGQIQVLINRLVFEQPWGEETDIISPVAPVGFTASGEDFSMGPEDFVLQGNIVPNEPPQVTE